MVDSVIDRFRHRVEQRVLLKEPLAGYTSFRIGGPAELLYTPCGEEDLVCSLRAARALKIPTTVLGNGTNVLVSDRGVEGLVIRLRTRHFGLLLRRVLCLPGHRCLWVHCWSSLWTTILRVWSIW